MCCKLRSLILFITVLKVLSLIIIIYIVDVYSKVVFTLLICNDNFVECNTAEFKFIYIYIFMYIYIYYVLIINTYIHTYIC